MSNIEYRLDSDSIRLYLSASGWTQAKADQRRTIWEHPSGRRVFVPVMPGSDVADLLQLAIKEVAKAEERDEDEVAIDVSWSQFDKLHVRRQGLAMSLTDALDLHSALFDTIVAGARASLNLVPRITDVGHLSSQLHGSGARDPISSRQLCRPCFAAPHTTDKPRRTSLGGSCGT